MASASTKDRRRVDSGWYVYGVVPADVVLEPDVYGMCDPPAPVEVVRHGDIAALVSEIDPSRPIGRPEDLQAHQRLLDEAAHDVPVLPLRFGAVVSSRAAVEHEFLDEHEHEFAEALDALAERVQYVVRARYREDVVMQEVLAENPTAASLADEVRGGDEVATRNVRIELGEVLTTAVAAKRDADTAALLDLLSGSAVEIAVRPPTHELDAAHLALLVERDRQRECESVVDRIAREWQDRVTFRLLGPMAAYDFVVTVESE
jgi:Gas vesicle synthesis protein GvpL/GvpF